MNKPKRPSLRFNVSAAHEQLVAAQTMLKTAKQMLTRLKQRTTEPTGQQLRTVHAQINHALDYAKAAQLELIGH